MGVWQKAGNVLRRQASQMGYGMKTARAWNAGAVWAEGQRDWLLSGKRPKLSVIVPTFKRIGPLIDCIESIRKYTTDYEIIVVNSGNGGFGDRWLDRQRKAGDVIVVLDNGRRFGKRLKSQSYFYNLGYQLANGDYVVHFADDCQALPGWTDEAYELLDNDPSVGLALFFGQPHVYGEFQHTIYHGTLDGKRHDYPVAHWFCGRKAELASIGFMDEDYNYYCNDLDMTMRVMHRLRKRVVCCSRSRILHLDKALVHRQKGAGAGDVTLFNQRWSAVSGVHVDDSSIAEVLGDHELSRWIAEHRFADALMA